MKYILISCTKLVLLFTYHLARQLSNWNRNEKHLELQCTLVILSSHFLVAEILCHVKFDRYSSWYQSLWKEWLYTTTRSLRERNGSPWLIIICKKAGTCKLKKHTHEDYYQSEYEGLVNSFNCLTQELWEEGCHVVSNIGINPTNCLSLVAKWQLICK